MSWTFDSDDSHIVWLRKEGIFDPRFSNSTVYIDPPLYKAGDPPVTIMPSFTPAHTHTIPLNFRKPIG